MCTGFIFSCVYLWLPNPFPVDSCDAFTVFCRFFTGTMETVSSSQTGSIASLVLWELYKCPSDSEPILKDDISISIHNNTQQWANLWRISWGVLYIAGRYSWQSHIVNDVFWMNKTMFIVTVRWCILPGKSNSVYMCYKGVVMLRILFGWLDF